MKAREGFMVKRRGQEGERSNSRRKRRGRGGDEDGEGK